MSKTVETGLGDRLRHALGANGPRGPRVMPATVTGPLGTVPGAGIDTTAAVPEPRKLSAAQAQNLMQAELIAAIRSLVESSTELAGRLGKRGAVNGVMESWAGVFPASGIIARTYEVAVGSITVENCSAANLITVQSGVPAGDTGGQTGGIGVSYVRANSRGIAPIGDHSLMLTGTAGDRVSFEVFTGLQPYGVNQ